MIKFVTGKPGGGKSLRSLRIVVETLLESEKLLVTNLPLNLDALTSYCLERDKVINVFERVLLLDKQIFSSEKELKQGLREFFLYRTSNGEKQTKPPADPKGDYLEALSFPVSTFGVVFIIDEIHKLWPARDFVKADKLIFEYLSEHRHFSDEVVFITQALAQVDKQIRLLGQDFEVIRNRKKEKYSIFAGPPTFTRYVFLSAPNGSGSQVPAEKHNFPLDLELANCYSTSAKGGEGDKGQKAKGIPFRAIYPFGAAAVFTLWLVATQGPKMLLEKEAPLPDPKIAMQEPPPIPAFGTTVNIQPLPTTPKQTKEITGFVSFLDGSGKVWFSDGSTANLKQFPIESVQDDGVYSRGVFYPYQKTLTTSSEQL